MAKITLEHQDEILTFPVDSILELKVESVIIETVESQRGGNWEKARFEFKILGIQAIGGAGSDTAAKEPYESWITRSIWGSVPWRLTDSPENRLRIWAEAIFRQELGEGFELDSDMFLQRNVRGLTSQYDAKGRDSKGAAFKRHQVETLLPWLDGAPPATPPQAPAQGWTPQPAAVQQDPWARASSQQPVPAGQPDPWAPLPYGDSEPPF